MKYTLLVTRYENKIVTALYDDRQPVQLMADEVQKNDLQLGNIYVGRVANIVKNLNAAFVEIRPGIMGYLSMDEPCVPIVKQTHADGRIHVGDELLVQIEREPIKTKAASLTAAFHLTGKYAVLVHGKPVIGVSSKIEDPELRNRLKSIAASKQDGSEFGFIIRTNAQNVSEEELLSEICLLKEKYAELCKRGITRNAMTLLESALPAYLVSLKENYSGMLERILTDDRTIYDEIAVFLREHQPLELSKLEYYRDDLPLVKLYSLKERIQEAIQPKVWLKSGATLIIEPTETLTVIDVNTGKAIKGRVRGDDFFLKINLEAAREIARQIRLRNLSGIILIDFIDMESEQSKTQLMAYLKDFLQKDPVKTVLVDITALQLVELTRKKVRRPLHEEFR